MNFLKVAGRDIKSIFKNRFIRVSVTAIIIVPLLYSLLYLYAFWDPYANLKDMPVAVVNLDKGATKDDKNVNFGNDMVDNLKKNDKVGWRFVSLSEGENGLKSKGYYAMFVIPEDFSSKIVNAKDSKPEPPKILYSSNDKKNFIASQINSRVSLELKNEVSKNITDEYTRAIFDKMYEIKDGMKTASEKSGELYDGIGKAKDGADKLKDGLGQLNSKTPELKDGVGKLKDGSEKLDSGLGTFIESALKPVSEAIGKLYDGVNTKLVSGIDALKSGADRLAAGLAQGKDGASKLTDAANGLSKGALGLSKGAEGLSTNAKALKQGGEQLGQGAGALKDGATKLNGGLGLLSKGLGDAASKTDDLSKGAAQVDAGVNELLNSVNTSQAALNDSVNNQLMKYLATHPEAMKDPNMAEFVKTLQTMNAAASSPQNQQKIAALKGGTAALKDGSNLLSQGIKKAASSSEELSKGSATLVTGLDTFKAGVDKFSLGAVAYGDGALSYAKGATDFSNGGKMYAEGANKLSAGMSEAVVGSQKLAAGLSDLNQGVLTVDGGLGTLNQKMPLALDGANKLKDGSGQVKDGIGTLNDKIPQLIDGANKLYEGSGELSEGMLKLHDGSKEFKEKLGESSDKINTSLVNSSETMGEFVSEPVLMDEKPVNPVKNYGTGFAPYFICLSLWVGAIMMFFVITDKVDDDIEASSASIVAGKFLSYGYIGILQSVLASVVVLGLGLKPNNMLLYILFTVFMSFVFIAIIQCFVFLFGDPGRLLAIVLLILQLTSCAGTFPLEVVPPMFKVLYPFMPFTYCVSALRELISGSDLTIVLKNVTVLASIMFAFLFISITLKGHADKVKDAIKEKKELA